MDILSLNLALETAFEKHIDGSKPATHIMKFEVCIW